MERSFWKERWDMGRIGFHQETPNSFLVKHVDLLQTELGERVFVPFCGKSRDMTWLAREGYRVFGAEWVEEAVQDFFVEQDLPYQVEGQVFSSERIQVFAGDMFEFETPVEWVFDRAALIALPPRDRPRYVSHLDRFLGPGGKILLVSIEYPQEEMSGPPFSVPEAEIEALFGPGYKMRLLERCGGVERLPKAKAQGVSRFKELAWLLTKT